MRLCGGTSNILLPHILQRGIRHRTETGRTGNSTDELESKPGDTAGLRRQDSVNAVSAVPRVDDGRDVFARGQTARRAESARGLHLGRQRPLDGAVRTHLPRHALRARTRNALKIPFNFLRMGVGAQYTVTVCRVLGWCGWDAWVNCGRWRNSRFALDPPSC